ncbi:MAG: hypothetical protein RLZZ95_951 [Pseudomonadota bacterium]|jgi:SEC-C motif-containing protein
MTAACPCGRTMRQAHRGSSSDRVVPLPLENCCGPYHQQLNAPDAESLMRSRYSAFVLGHVDYLLATWHDSQRPASLTLEAGAQWLGLEIKQHQCTGEHTAEVTFVARFRVGGKAVRQHERSRFVREEGRWFYLDGDVL